MDDPRIERCHDDCLSFAALTQLASGQRATDPAEEQHLASCKRCRTLHQRMLAAPSLSERQLAELDAAEQTVPLHVDPRPWVWQALRMASPVVSAACLVLAVWFAGRPRPAAPIPPAYLRLRDDILQCTSVIDPALRLLNETPRATDDAERLQSANKALREQLRRLTDVLEELILAARTSSPG